MSVTLKGNREGIRVLLDPQADLSALLERLDQVLSEHRRFLAGAQLIVDTAGRPLSVPLAAAVLEAAARHGVTVKALLSHPLREAAGQGGGGHRIVYGTVRNGQECRCEGDLVVMGDVNAGAKVVATGDVLVLGALRGTVHAGFPGDHRRLVYAQDFAPPQVRIGKLMAANPSPGPGDGPELARVEDDAIVVEPWRPAAGRSAGRPRRFGSPSP